MDLTLEAALHMLPQQHASVLRALERIVALYEGDLVFAWHCRPQVDQLIWTLAGYIRQHSVQAQPLLDRAVAMRLRLGHGW